GRAAGPGAGGGGAAGRAVVHAGGPQPAGAGGAGADRRGAAGFRADPARDHRPGRRGAHRRRAHRRLQNGEGTASGVRRGRAVPDEVLRAGGVAAEERRAAPSAAGVPGQRRRADVRPRARRSGAGRAQAAGPVGRDPAGHRDGRLASAAHQAVRLVRPPGALPRVRRHSPALPAAGAAARAARRLTGAGPGARRAPAGNRPPAAGQNGTGLAKETYVAIRVLLVDDQPLLRTGFRMILEAEQDLAVVGEAGDGLQALDQVRALQPDVVLMDIRMPRMDGVEATRQITGPERNGPAKVLVLTTFDLDEYVVEALKA